MQPVLSADGLKVNWVNYKTGINGISFKMDADNRSAHIGILLHSNDDELRKSQYTQLHNLRSMLQEKLGEAWTWQEDTVDDYGKPVSRIGTKISGVNIARTEDWPQLISFFKPRIIALDEFWNMAKYGFEL